MCSTRETIKTTTTTTTSRSLLLHVVAIVLVLHASYGSKRELWFRPVLTTVVITVFITRTIHSTIGLLYCTAAVLSASVAYGRRQPRAVV
jgi:hypothetical protein